jgi:hypothetical protein
VLGMGSLPDQRYRFRELQICFGFGVFGGL